MPGRLARLTIVVLAFSAFAGLAQNQGPSVVAQETRVRGTPPALVGRWLLVTTLGSGGPNRSTASLWEIAEGPVLREHLVDLPPVQRARLGAGGWIPTAEDLAMIGEQWAALAPADRGVVRMRHELIGVDGMDEAMLRDPLAKDALWIVRQTYAFEPGGTRPTEEHRLLVARSGDSGGFGGAYTTATIAMAPMPIPIKLDGTFRLLRVPTQRPLWARLGDIFRGCN